MTNLSITTHDLALKGLSHTDVIKLSNEIEYSKNNKIKEQFMDKNALYIDKTVKYKNARESLHKYLHSFAL